MRNKVAFIIHPLNVLDFRLKKFLYSPYEKQIDWLLQKLSPVFVKNVFSSLPVHSFMEIKGFKSLKGSVVDILGVMCPMFPDEIVRNKKKAYEKIKASVLHAIGKGANVIVLAGFTSILGNQGEEIREDIGKKREVVITSGNTLTSAICLKGIERAVKEFEFDIQSQTVAIVGATGDIGSVCAKILASKSKRIILSSRNLNVDNQLYNEIKNNLNRNVTIENDVRLAVSNADLVLVTTSSVFPLISFSDLKKNSIICDVSLPYNISKKDYESQNSIFVFDGGKARVPNIANLNSKKWIDFTNNFHSIPGCLLEGLILALENMKEDFSLGRGNITQEKIDLIYRLAVEHGFDVSEFAFHERFYSKNEMFLFKETLKER